MLAQRAPTASRSSASTPARSTGPGPAASVSIDGDLFKPLRRGQAAGAARRAGSASSTSTASRAGTCSRPTAGGDGERYILSDRHVTLRELAEAVVRAGHRGRVPPTLPVPAGEGAGRGRASRRRAAPASRRCCPRAAHVLPLERQRPTRPRPRRSSAGSRRCSRTGWPARSRRCDGRRQPDHPRAAPRATSDAVVAAALRDRRRPVRPVHGLAAGGPANVLTRRLPPAGQHGQPRDRARRRARRPRRRARSPMFPVVEGDARAQPLPAPDVPQHAAVALAANTYRIFRLGGRQTPPAPADALYVDALATVRRVPPPRHRDRAAGGGRGARRARRAWRKLALDTADRNTGAQALYEAFGMHRTEETPPARRDPRVDRLRQATGVARRARRVSASATCATSDSLSPGKNGSARQRRAASSAFGNSPSRWPKRSR